MAGDDADRPVADFGCSYARLQAVKVTWDPDNVFHLNQNIHRLDATSADPASTRRTIE